jgi:hypothetical protein
VSSSISFNPVSTTRIETKVASLAPRVLFSILLGASACVPSQPPETTGIVAVDRSRAVQFAYPLADGSGALRSDALLGQPAILAFVTTFDLASQAEARFLSGVFRRHGGRVHAAAVVLEPGENRPLVLAFRDALKLVYPVAIGDAALITGEGPFGDVHAVPSTVVLDKDGRLIWKRIGLAAEEELEKGLAGS